MRILLTNDDSVYASGLSSLWSTLQGFAEVQVVAPDRERSATGHGITVDRPLRAERVTLADGDAWAVNGTPADCVKLGVNCLLNEKPDLIIAGINRGPNLGIDVLYSGTVSGALEGIILGIPALAVSVTDYRQPDYRFAASFVCDLVPRLTQAEIFDKTLLNINVPSLPAHEVEGIRITRLGARRYLNSFDVRTDPRGRTYYWLGGEVVDLEQEPDTDISAIKQNMVSITPINVDNTDFNAIELLKDLFMDFIGEEK
jgi:5'-nucleotidase